MSEIFIDQVKLTVCMDTYTKCMFVFAIYSPFCNMLTFCYFNNCKVSVISLKWRDFKQKEEEETV